MNYKLTMVAFILMIVHATSAHKVYLRSTENENSESIQTVVNNINQFSSEIYAVLSKNSSDESIVCSPFSVAMVLMMVAYGAGGITLEEINKVLHANSDVHSRSHGIHFIINQLKAVKGIELRLANNIFINNGFAIKPDFEVSVKTIFQSDIKSLNFSNSVAASQTINDWCEKQTNSRIKDIVEPNDFNDKTALVLVNAVYFKGNWIKKFNVNDTKLRSFYLNNNTTKNIPMMYNFGKYRYGELSQISARFIELPYESADINNTISMIIILPNEINGLQMVAKNLHKVNLIQLFMGTQYEVDLLIPKFKIENKIDLKVALSALGMTEIFGNNVNLTGITKSPLKVSKIMQKAFIEVNEEGSEAAAVTEIELENRIGYDDITKQTLFHVDHPFLALIATQDVILFNVHVVDPNF